jgi:hypothetical protein
MRVSTTGGMDQKTQRLRAFTHSATVSHAFSDRTARMMLLPSTGANARSFCAT